MIDLTPLEVRQKKADFRRSFRGYDPGLVDDFLDLVADRMEELVKQNMALTDSVRTLEREVAEYREKDRSLSEALVAAQDLREEARDHASRERELLLREAQMEAESARDEAARMLAREEEALRGVRARRAQLVKSFRRLLERELSELETIEETLELEPGPVEARAPEQAPEAGSSPDRELEGPHEATGPESAIGPEAPEAPAADEAGDAPDPEVPEWGAPAGGTEPVEPAPPRSHGLDASGLDAPELERSAAPQVDPAPLGGGAAGGDSGLDRPGADAAADEEDEDEQEDWLKSLVEE